jgi:acyl-coenzyme A synthetase/AMP-(fatty) acid ligase
MSIADPRRGAALIAVTDQTGSLWDFARGVEAYNQATAGPRRITGTAWTPAIPRTALGKVKRAALRDLLGVDTGHSTGFI